MDLGLSGKVALAAASSAGIGRAIAGALAAEGMDLVMCASEREGPGRGSAGAGGVRESGSWRFRPT